LEKVAQALQSVIKRPADLLARYGGEEFVVILPETHHEGAKKVAEACRVAVASLGFKHEFSQVADHVTISLGVATGQLSDLESAYHLLQKADEALYRAKQSGRNQLSAIVL